MKKFYVVSAITTRQEFATEAEARRFFEEIKYNYSYCELAVAEISDSGVYYAKSIEIIHK